MKTDMTESELVWARRVAQWKASGLTSKEFCEGKSFTHGGLRHWATRLRRRELPGQEAESSDTVVRLARVVHRSAVNLPELPGTGASPSPSPIFVLCGSLRIELRPGFDRDTMATLLDLLNSRGGDR